jgi:DNA polymerase III epsilon subunit-like protein
MIPLLIAGSRSIKSYEVVSEAAQIALQEWGLTINDINELVSGHATGTDQLGEYWADANDIPKNVMEADWKDLSHADAVIRPAKWGGGFYDARAGHRRNEDMAKYIAAREGRAIIVWDGTSSGSSDMRDLCEEYEIPYRLFTFCIKRIKKNNQERSRIEVIDWAKQIITSDAVVIDTESSGGSRLDEIINIGVVRAADGKILLDTLIRPKDDLQFNYYASKVHGITKEHLADAPTLDEIWSDIQTHTHQNTVVAYNISADKRMIKQTADKYELEMPEIEWYCLMKGYQRYMQRSAVCKLSQACLEMNAKGGDHSAVADALATARLIHRIAKEYQPKI